MKLDQPGILSFNEATHSYDWSGVPLVSVTTLIDRYKRGFDEQAMSSRVAAREGRTRSSVLAQWATKRDAACDLGNDVHNEAERIAAEINATGTFTADADTTNLGFKKGLWRFFYDHAELMHGILMAEFQVFYPEVGLAGMVDFICNLDGLRTIVDWKTNEKLQLQGYDKMRRPINDLRDCNLMHYSLQLNTYRRILSRRYGYHADQMVLVHFGGNGRYERIRIPFMDDHLDVLLKHFVKSQNVDVRD